MLRNHLKINLFLKNFKLAVSLVLLFSLSLSLPSCTSKFQKLVKSNDYNQKLEGAIKYYNKQNYYRSLQLLEELISLLRGTDKAEKVYYYYAYCHYGQGDYMLAGFHFKNYYTTFPHGEKSTECLFMSAYCKFLDSPDSGLDQSETIEAMKELQLFINKFPQNDSVTRCNQLMYLCRLKLKKKAFDQAKMYYNIKDYKAAIRTFINILKDYPDIENREEIMYLIVRAHYKYAMNSIADKKKIRYEETTKACNNFILAYPNSKYLKEVTSISNESSKEISKFANSNT